MDKLDELSGTPSAAPTNCDVGTSVTVWGCSPLSLLKEVLVPCEGTQRCHTSPQLPALLHSCFGREQGEGLARALPCHVFGKTEGTVDLQ